MYKITNLDRTINLTILGKVIGKGEVMAKSLTDFFGITRYNGVPVDDEILMELINQGEKAIVTKEVEKTIEEPKKIDEPFEIIKKRGRK